MVNRAAFDRIVEAGGYITVTTGGAPDANLIPIPKDAAEAAMDAAACIGCGACVAACPNSAASLFTSAKMQHLNLLPQGQAERWDRSRPWSRRWTSSSAPARNYGECGEACPKEISIDFIAMMNRTTSRRSGPTAVRSASARSVNMSPFDDSPAGSQSPTP
jgi:succinate dehydrogenase / fumarate reductase iron-sulfur subunit